MSTTEMNEIQRALGRLEADLKSLLSMQHGREAVDRRLESRLTKLEHWKIGFTASLSGAFLVLGFLASILWKLLELLKR